MCIVHKAVTWIGDKMITTKYGQNEIDTTVIYAFEMALENATDEINDIEELHDIMIGANDELINNWESLNVDQKDIALKRLNKLLDNYWEYQKGVKCDVCEELSVATTIIVNAKTNEHARVECCPQHLHMAMEEPIELIKLYFGTEGGNC